MSSRARCVCGGGGMHPTLAMVSLPSGLGQHWLQLPELFRAHRKASAGRGPAGLMWDLGSEGRTWAVYSGPLGAGLWLSRSAGMSGVRSRPVPPPRSEGQVPRGWPGRPSPSRYGYFWGPVPHIHLLKPCSVLLYAPTLMPLPPYDLPLADL